MQSTASTQWKIHNKNVQFSLFIFFETTGLIDYNQLKSVFHSCCRSRCSVLSLIKTCSVAIIAYYYETISFYSFDFCFSAMSFYSSSTKTLAGARSKSGCDSTTQRLTLLPGQPSNFSCPTTSFQVCNESTRILYSTVH